MRVIQIVISLSYGDGVSSCILALRNILNENRVENIIAANNIDSRISENNIVRFTNCAELMINEEDIVIYHFCIGNALNREVENLKCKKTGNINSYLEFVETENIERQMEQNILITEEKQNINKENT